MASRAGLRIRDRKPEDTLSSSPLAARKQRVPSSPLPHSSPRHVRASPVRRGGGGGGGGRRKGKGSDDNNQGTDGQNGCDDNSQEDNDDDDDDDDDEHHDQSEPLEQDLEDIEDEIEDSEGGYESEEIADARRAAVDTRALTGIDAVGVAAYAKPEMDLSASADTAYPMYAGGVLELPPLVHAGDVHDRQKPSKSMQRQQQTPQRQYRPERQYSQSSSKRRQRLLEPPPSQLIVSDPEHDNDGNNRLRYSLGGAVTRHPREDFAGRSSRPSGPSPGRDPSRTPTRSSKTHRSSTASKAATAEALVVVTPVKPNPRYCINAYSEIINNVDLDAFNYILAKLLDGRFLELQSPLLTPRGCTGSGLDDDEEKSHAVFLLPNVWRRQAVLELQDLPLAIGKHIYIAQSLLDVDEMCTLRSQISDGDRELSPSQLHRQFTKLAERLENLLLLLIGPGLNLSEIRGGLFGQLLSYIHFQIFFSRMSAGQKCIESDQYVYISYRKRQARAILDDAFQLRRGETTNLSPSQATRLESSLENLKAKSEAAINTANLSEEVVPFDLIEETYRSIMLQAMRPTEKEPLPEFYEGPLRYLISDRPTANTEMITKSVRSAHIAFNNVIKDPLEPIDSRLNVRRQQRAIVYSSTSTATTH
ncbi:hypothetical protein BASA83_003330 [Batrachochytrium salamandrivorans]|nr:hypothetical protein BASA83_003330 [Batrachochytrium salamandrivorans]